MLPIAESRLADEAEGRFPAGEQTGRVVGQHLTSRARLGVGLSVWSARDRERCDVVMTTDGTALAQTLQDFPGNCTRVRLAQVCVVAGEQVVVV